MLKHIEKNGLEGCITGEYSLEQEVGRMGSEPPGRGQVRDIYSSASFAKTYPRERGISCRLPGNEKLLHGTLSRGRKGGCAGG